jgi:hypothetical protein
MRRILFFIVFFAVTLSSAVVSEERARNVAENYYYNYDKISVPKGSSLEKVLTKEYLGEPTWYVFIFTEGFVIVSADDNVDPILGFSYEGRIEDEDLNNLSNPFANRFSFFDKQIVHGIRQKKLERPVKQSEWKNIETLTFITKPSQSKNVANLLTTKWHQGYPFNINSPANCPAGCVATAMSQIMYFHGGPAAGAGSKSYNDIWGDTTGSHSVNFSSHNYNYELIQNCNYGASFDTEQKKAEIAKITYHCGVSVETDYNTNSSGAYLEDALTAYETNWSFDTAAAYTYHGTITDSSYYSATIKSNLDNARPVQWAGHGTGGHSFVICGYENLTPGGYWYWFNWGWGGSYNGWFRINDLSPDVYDFSISQESITGLFVSGLLSQMPSPSSCTASVSDGDVTVSWGAPPTVNPMATLTDYFIYRDGILVKQMGGTGIRTWTDEALYEGTFTYYIKAVYQNPDGTSLASPSYTVSVIQNTSYPCPLNLSATSYLNCRTKIDLSWFKPFVGTTFIEDDFEDATGMSLPSAWWQRCGNTNPPTSWVTKPSGDLGWVTIPKASYPEYVFQGNYSCGANSDGETYTWEYMISNNSFILPEGQKELIFYPLLHDGTQQGVFLYTGPQYDSTPTSGEFILLKDYQPDKDQSWFKETIDLSSYVGTYRLGFYKKSTGGGGLFSVDNIVIGIDTYPSGNQPLSYEIYSNGSLETTVPCTGLTETYESTGFSDGLNKYHVRAVYVSDKNSIASNPSSAWMDANPAPNYLEGTYDEANDDVDLTWYSPGHYPRHWFGYVWENDSWNYITMPKDATADITKLRTYFSAGDFGMAYPVHISQISAAFYEDTGTVNWSSNQFKIAIGTGSGSSAVYLHTSVNLTALKDGTWIDYALPETYSFSEPWWVEVQPQSPSDCTPSLLSFLHLEGTDSDQWNSVWYYAGDGTYGAGWYAYSYISPYEFEDFSLMCLGSNDEPYIYKGTKSYKEPVEYTSIQIKKDMNKNRAKSLRSFNPKIHDDSRTLELASDKGLNQYQIWRNNERYATVRVTLKNYKDTMPLNNNTYFVTAIYTIPEGESDPSNKFSIDILHDPDTPANITTYLSNGKVVIDWDDSVYASDYNVYASDSPYGVFTLLETVSASMYEYTPSQPKKFFFITSTNNVKAAETIFIPSKK